MISSANNANNVKHHHPYNFSPLRSDDSTYGIQFKWWEELLEWVKLVFAGLFVLAFLTLMLYMFLFFRFLPPPFEPEPPAVVLHSLYVTNLTKSNGELAAIWGVKLTISNSNVTEMSLKSIEGTIFYKQKEALATTKVDEDFNLSKGESKRLHLKIATTGWESDQPVVDDWVVEEVLQDRQKGTVSISFRLRMVVTYSWIDHWAAVISLKCEDLMVPFVSGSSESKLINPTSRKCLLLTKEWRSENEGEESQKSKRGPVSIPA